MPPQPTYTIPLDAPRPVADPIHPSTETMGLFSWKGRTSTLDHDSVQALQAAYTGFFGSPFKASQAETEENDLRNTNRMMLSALVEEAVLAFETEISLDKLGPNARERWLNSDLHKRYIDEVVQAGKRYANTTDMKRLDLALRHRATGIIGLIAEFKLLRPPKNTLPGPFHAVWRECFYQAAWYLAGAHYMVDTRLAIAIVNSKFQRLHMNDNTLSVEVHANVAARERGRVTTIRQLEESAVWDHGPPHDFFDLSTCRIIESEFKIYRETYAQGAILSSRMRAARENQPGQPWQYATTTSGTEMANVSFNTDGQVDAASLKVNKWAQKSHDARRKPRDPPTGKPPRGPNGGAGGSGGNVKGRAKQIKSSTAQKTTASTPTSGARKARKSTKSAPKKKRRVLNVLFPWRWFRRDDHDDDPPSAAEWVPALLDTYRVQLVTPQEMDKIIAAEVSKVAAKPNQVKMIPTRVALPQQRQPHVRPQPNAWGPRYDLQSAGRTGRVY